MDNSTECFGGLRLSLSHRGTAGQRYASLVRGAVATIMLPLWSATFLSAQTALPDAPKIKVIDQQDQEAGSAAASSSQSD